MRFTGEQAFSINNAKDYQKTLLDKAQIEVDFDLRKQRRMTRSLPSTITDKSLDSILATEINAGNNLPLASSM
jgi:glycyl-tRNA synthetase beta subunit